THDQASRSLVQYDHPIHIQLRCFLNRRQFRSGLALLAARLMRLEYPDRPQPRTDDWQDQVRPVDLRLSTLPFRDLMQSADEDGGLKQQLPLFDEAVPDRGDALSGEERRFEDEADPAADLSQMQCASGAASGTVRRARAVTRDHDDLLPAF